MRARDAIAAAAAKLPGDCPRLDAELLAAHVLGVDRNELLLRHLHDDLDEAAFGALVERRMGGEPVAYILGHREFWSLDFRVTPDTLIPRPDSETIVEAALAAAGPAPRVLDLGTGSGCLLLSVLHERPGAWGLGVDRSEGTASVAADNAQRLGLADRSAFIVGDWTAAIGGRFDIILSNPPYVGTEEVLAPEVADYEPGSALFAGQGGLDDYRKIIPALTTILSPGGSAHLEIGYLQADLVSEIAVAHGLLPTLRRDLAGRPRCLSLRAADAG
ncbi:peptide chain release factor N(5)-glutamine methyltransferase [Sphingoaurantiacus capsulatus]|uniref:Release factor glutamine methyltransferase n=1 Tax=Sphingoaurantiacus capsulatus TaxID=1771310 RepID=A0ABV7X4A3_9SPHN